MTARRAKLICNILVINQLNLKRLVRLWWLIVSLTVWCTGTKYQDWCEPISFLCAQWMDEITAPLTAPSKRMEWNDHDQATHFVVVWRKLSRGRMCIAIYFRQWMECRLDQMHGPPQPFISHPIDAYRKFRCRIKITELRKWIGQEMYSVASVVNNFSITTQYSGFRWQCCAVLCVVLILPNEWEKWTFAFVEIEVSKP